MKKILTATVMATVVIFLSTSVVYAMEASSLGDKSFDVYMFCTDDAGNFCDILEITNDTFVFKGGGGFEIASFGNTWLGLGSGGSYSENMLLFNVDYTVVNEALDKYTFSMSGINILDTIIMGTMEVVFYDWDIISYDKEDEAFAVFVGLVK